MGRSNLVSFSLLVVALSLSLVLNVSPTGADCLCPDDWLNINDVCFKLFKDTQNRDSAQAFCKQQPLECELGKIGTEKDRAKLAEYLIELSIDEAVWIKMGIPLKKGPTTGDKVWNPEIVLEKLMADSCVVLHPKKGFKKWRDENCVYSHYFVCQCYF